MPILDEMVIPIKEKVFYFLQKGVSGTDDIVDKTELKRSYLTFWAAVFSAQVESVLISERNLPMFSEMVQFLLDTAIDYMDISTGKMAMSLLLKAILNWAKDPETCIPSPPSTKKSSLPTKQSQALPGFDQFIYNSVVVLIFHKLILQPQFNLQDAQSLILLAEVSSLLKGIYKAQGSKCNIFLKNILFPSISIPNEIGNQFIESLSALDTKAFKKFLQVSFL